MKASANYCKMINKDLLEENIELNTKSNYEQMHYAMATESKIFHDSM